jgi:hypothetical protein
LWSAVPFTSGSLKLAKLVRFDKLPVQLSGADEYNFQDDFVAPKWAVNFLFPI